MTQVDFFKTITNNDTLDAELREFAANEIAKIDAANAKRRAKNAEKAKENEPFYAQIAEILANGTKTTSEVAAELGVSTQKTSALLRKMVELGTLTVATVDVPKKGSQKAYTIAD